MAAELDHVIMLLPYELIVHPPPWLTDLFVISPGGLHADGKTENRLVHFQDGTYLELIAFINDDPEKRRGHWWDKPYGIVDFALTTTQDEDFGTLPAIRHRLSQTGTDISYADPQEGGRLTPEGSELRWRVTFPTGTSRGTVPFWCHDLTPRQRRVPMTPASSTHPCGATGIGGIQLRVGVEESSVSGLSKALAAIVGKDWHADDGRYYEIGVPQGNPAVKPSIRIIERDEKKNAKGDPSLMTLVVQTPLGNLPALHHHIEDDVVSILLEQVAESAQQSQSHV